MAEIRYNSRRVWAYSRDSWDPAWYHKFGFPFFSGDEWGRRTVTVGLWFIGYVCWAWRTCWCQECHEVREQTYRWLNEDRAEETTPGDDTIRTYTRTTSTSTFTTPWTVGGATRRSGPRTDLEIEDAIDVDASRRALADPAPSVPLDEVLAVQDHPAVRVATDALAERLEAMWGGAPDGFGRVMLREYADAVAPAVLRWAGDQIRAEAAQLEERDGAGYSYAYGFAAAADFIDPTAGGKTNA